MPWVYAGAQAIFLPAMGRTETIGERRGRETGFACLVLTWGGLKLTVRYSNVSVSKSIPWKRPKEHEPELK